MSTDDSFRMRITVGGAYTGATLASVGGEPITGADGWRARSQIRRGYGGPLVATFAEQGATGDRVGDGTVVIDDYGVLEFTLPATFTATLTPTTDSVGQNNTALVCDVEVWNVDAPAEVFKSNNAIRVFIKPEVTTS